MMKYRKKKNLKKRSYMNWLVSMFIKRRLGLGGRGRPWFPDLPSVSAFPALTDTSSSGRG